MSSDKAEYMPLQPADTSSPDSSDDQPYTAQKHALLLPPLLILAFLAALGTTMLNVSLLPFTLSALQSQKQGPRWPEPTYEPERYIGLNRPPLLEGAAKDFSQLIPFQYRNGTQVDVNVVFPSVMAHVNQSDPEVVYTAETAGEHKKFVLSHENSMIMQFTNLDPTKSSCAVVGFRPSTSDLTVPRPYTADGEINVIEVWNLTLPSTGSSLLDAQTLSYDHRPPRSNYVGNIDFRQSPNSTTNHFRCPVGEHASVAIEFRCQRWACWVEMDMVRGEADGERLGFELAQWNEEPEKA
ncbi:hypothetical protein CALCODRAFT_500514 [Calocera cornea HHB12733]|uniref:Ubiquitin 3 binding protein But2 C-terminal domain-containing protein n=1 Tax=Calocera cornea HHB12733 TaxID=1353952 RepID=A0A165E2C0_9BASI|nr:hypothetical protein CALCODRAFT_500514 [Calocera cornea HHB12733]